ncbi:MAG TPA: hypothetical protein VFW75_04185 [Acetobacteraceae bacterium]|nr:hypothetical protein [Acetobacteraceae bacterium]
MNAEPLLQITFGSGGNDASYLGTGWSGDESGYRWTVAGSSELWLENPGAHEFVLELEVTPFALPPILPAQRLRIYLRQSLIGECVLTRPGRLGFRIPASALRAPGPVRLRFEHPDAARPIDLGGSDDERTLAISFHRLTLSRLTGGLAEHRLGPESVLAADFGRLTGIPAVQFMQRFESLGDNCEFGLVQRRCGAEPLGLLRFANLELRQLLLSLQTGFAGIGNAENMACWLSDGPRREYVIRDRQHALVFHTFLYEGEVDESELIGKQAMRLQFLRRKLLEDLDNAEKIFVCKRNDPLAEQEVLPLHAALRRFGANTLLWVVPGDAAHPAGAVDRVMPGLLRGYIDRFAPYENAHDLSLDTWLSICLNAHRLAHRQDDGTGP